MIQPLQSSPLELATMMMLVLKPTSASCFCPVGMQSRKCSSAPASKRSVMMLLKRLTTIANFRPAAFRLPSIAGFGMLV